MCDRLDGGIDSMLRDGSLACVSCHLVDGWRRARLVVDGDKLLVCLRGLMRQRTVVEVRWIGYKGKMLEGKVSIFRRCRTIAS